MKRFGCAGLTDEISSLPGQAVRALRAVALTLLLLGVSVGVSAAGKIAPATAAPKPQNHVYLLRGAFNIFSLGMDEIAARVQRMGVATTVTNYLGWESLADEAAAAYKSGRIKNIILVGHSSGATAVTEMAARLGAAGRTGQTGDRARSDHAYGRHRKRWPIRELLCRRRNGYVRRQGQAVHRQPEQHRLGEKPRYRSLQHRQEPGRAGSGHQGYPRRFIACFQGSIAGGEGAAAPRMSVSVCRNCMPRTHDEADADAAFLIAAFLSSALGAAFDPATGDPMPPAGSPAAVAPLRKNPRARLSIPRLCGHGVFARYRSARRADRKGRLRRLDKRGGDVLIGL